MKTQRYSIYMGPPKRFSFREKWSLIAPVVGAFILFVLFLVVVMPKR